MIRSRHTGAALAGLLGLTVGVTVGLGVGLPAAAWAEDPKVEVAKKEEVKEVEWKASASAGMILSTGNARALALSGSAAVSRKAGDDKVSLEAAGAYARSELLVAVDADGNGTIAPGEISRATQTTAKSWNVKLRYDRFFGAATSGFVTARLGADEPAGKELVGGGQLGGSRQLYKDDMHEIIAELGYDLTFESYVAKASDLAIHSLRAFLGYSAKLSDDTGVVLNVEALFNLNRETGQVGEISPFEDTRLVAKAALTTKLVAHVDFRFSFTAKLDNAPAPQPPFKLPYDAGFVPLADKLDAITEVALIVSLL